MPEARIPSRSAVRLLQSCALLLCLFAPSIWMIATIPPLWRDVDAYNQLTRDPLVTTFWGHAPAYSYAAKVPLYLGEQLERWRGIPVADVAIGLSPLSDTGVWLLIVAQHLALAGASFYFILAISNSFWVRLAVSLVWASNALFYTFAHCVGSETLSLILIVLVVAKGLRLIQHRGNPRWIDWYIFTVGLWLCLLSRQVNLLLILLLPATFLLSWAQNRISSRFATGDRQKRWLQRLGARRFRQSLIAISVGIACIAVAHSLTHHLARKTRFHPHSRMGYTFLFRLQFLKPLPPPARAALLEKVSARASSKEARQLVILMGQMYAESADPDAERFSQRAIPLLFPGETIVPWEKFDVALNQMAYAILLPPIPEHLDAARTDFVAALRTPATEIVDNLFETTGYFFEHKDAMPACASLVTFRDASLEAISRIPSQHSYFYLWRGVTCNKLFVIWFLSLLILLLIARKKKVNVRAIPSYGIALVAVGLLITATNSLLTEFLPRFVLPIWQLLLLSFLILAGSAADVLIRGSGESPPGSLSPRAVRGCRKPG